MNVQENKRIVREALEEIWNHGHLDAVSHAYHPAFAARVSGHPYQDLDAYRMYIAETREAFPDIHMVVDEQIGEGDKVVTRYTLTGTHSGPFIGWAPSHARIRVTGITISRLHNGLIRESCSQWDQIGLFHQIGIVPELV